MLARSLFYIVRLLDGQVTWLRPKTSSDPLAFRHVGQPTLFLPVSAEKTSCPAKLPSQFAFRFWAPRKGHVRQICSVPAEILHTSLFQLGFLAFRVRDRWRSHMARYSSFTTFQHISEASTGGIPPGRK